MTTKNFRGVPASDRKSSSPSPTARWWTIPGGFRGRLPAPPFLMVDRILEISGDGHRGGS